MYRRIHNQFGTAGMILSVVAIVLALTGGAIAASGGKPGPRGPRGKTGKTGPQGPQGLAGTNGTNGKDGAQGIQGEKGEKGDQGNQGIQGIQGIQGNPGTSVTGVGEPAGANCANAGVKYTSASGDNYVCNGTTGFTETLPEGKTETGAWSAYIPATFGAGYAAAPFSIPLAAELDNQHVVKVQAGQEGPLGECSHGATQGTANNPLASPGYLCAYMNYSFPPGVEIFNIAKAGIQTSGASKSGAIIQLAGPVNEVTEETEEALAYGTFAVTAP